jgi:cytochrome P450
MGLVETIAEHASIKSVVLFLIGAWLLQFVVNRIIEHIRIKRLGNYGKGLPYYLPFGIDTVIAAVKATVAAKNLEMWRDVYFKEKDRWTAEGRIFNQRIVFTADTENIKAILATQFTDFGKGEPFHAEWSDFLGDSIFTTDGNKWHASRQLIRPQFTRDRVSDLHCFEDHMKTLFRAIDNGGALDSPDQFVKEGSGSGKVIDFSEILFRFTLDVATDFLLGKDTQSLTSPKNEFADAFNEVQRVQNIIARVSKMRHYVPKASFWKGLDVMNRFINFYIERALALDPEELNSKAKSDKGYTFLHELASFTRDRKVLRDQIVAVLLAGRDTTASTLSWVIYELSRHPHAVKKLREEILSTIGKDAMPTYEHLKNMPYLKAILNETLRLYPSVPFNVRLALKDCTLPRGGGRDGREPLPVLKDTPVAYSTLVMQRRADLYPPISDKFADPEVFSPERWANWHPKPHDYIPFNAGPRICIGQQFALTEMSYVLSRLFQRFERVTSHMYEIDGGSPRLKADIVLSPGQGVKVAFWDPEV